MKPQDILNRLDDSTEKLLVIQGDLLEANVNNHVIRAISALIDTFIAEAEDILDVVTNADFN